MSQTTLANRPAPPAAPPLAVFDLDGTLLRGDSFLPFLVTYALRRRRLLPLLVLPFVVALYACRALSDRRAKERLLVAFLGGEETAVIDEHAEWFCVRWVSKKWRPALVERLRDHQRQGHRVILLSASPALYVEAIGRALGVEEVVATRVEAREGRCGGRIVGENCKGPHKVAMLSAHLGTDEAPAGSSAYGDSSSDLPVLRWAGNGYLIQAGELVEVNSPTFRPHGKIARLVGLALGLFGVLFCLQWAVGTLFFPAYKERLIGYLPVAAGALLGLALCARRVREPLGDWLTGLPRRRFLLTLAALALALRIAAIFVFPTEPANDHRWFHLYAVRMLDGEGYGGVPWPYLLHLNEGGGPRAFYPPGMTFLLLPLYAVFGVDPRVGEVVNGLFGVALVLLVYDIGRRAGGERVARWAAVLTALLPTLVFYSATLGYEVILGALLAAVVDLALIGGERPRLWQVLLMGLLLGAASLLKPIALLVPGMLLVWWLVVGAKARSFAYAGVAALGLALVVAPWTYRNSRVLGGFVPVSTNGGYVLYSANSPWTTGVHTAAERPAGEVDEVTMDKSRSQAAVAWMKANPGRFLQLAAVKSFLTWGTSSMVMSYISCDRMPGWQESICMAVLNTTWTALLVLCVFATLRTRAWRDWRMTLPVLLLAYLFVLHCVFEAHSRHHVPLVWVLALVAAWGLSSGERRQAA